LVSTSAIGAFDFLNQAIIYLAIQTVPASRIEPLVAIQYPNVF
jgi:hypothetical protein